MFKSIIFALCSLYSVSANFYFTEPIASSWWLGGDSLTLRWETPDNSQQVLEFFLQHGDPNNLQTITHLGSSPIGAKFVSVKLPAYLPAGGDYVVVGKGGNDVNYSHTFNVKAR